jgi:hypothetical protein
MHQKWGKQIEEVGQKQNLGEEVLLIVEPILRHITP